MKEQTKRFKNSDIDDSKNYHHSKNLQYFRFIDNKNNDESTINKILLVFR